MNIKYILSTLYSLIKLSSSLLPTWRPEALEPGPQALPSSGSLMEQSSLISHIALSPCTGRTCLVVVHLHARACFICLQHL